MLGIYRRPGRFVVKSFEKEGLTALWALLGSSYTRERGQKLADLLTEELIEIKSMRKSPRRASGEKQAVGENQLTPITV